jgi:hypothetical protein
MPILSNLPLTTDMLPSAILVLVWLGLMRSVRYSGWGVALISFVGTWLHELSHYLTGFLLCAKPMSFTLWPKRDGDQWVLGSVGFTNLNIWNAAPVAFAPLMLIGLGGLLFVYWSQPAFVSGHYLSWLLSSYVVACCFFSCLPSTTDIRIGALSGLMYGAIGCSLWYATQ